MLTVKKCMWYICSILLFAPLLFNGCSTDNGEENRETSPYKEVNTMTGIWIEVKEKTAKPTGLELIFHNTTEREDYFYGAWYVLELYTKEQWLTVTPLPGVEWTMEDWARPVYTQGVLEMEYCNDDFTEWSSYQRNEMGYDWEWYYGELPSGEYRIVTYLLSNFEKPIKKTTPRYYLAASFSID